MKILVPMRILIYPMAAFSGKIKGLQNGTKMVKIRLVLIMMVESKVFWVKKRMQENPEVINFIYDQKTQPWYIQDLNILNLIR